ncbi:MAG: hypothetical protein ABEJ55_02520 [Halanaeroarchaeum sp.]
MAPASPGRPRRSFLRYAAALSIGSLAGCSSGGGDGSEPNHAVPHPTETVPDAEATATTLGGQTRPADPGQTRDGVGYQHVPNGGDYCGNCSVFVPDEDGDGFGACALVEGTIHRCDYCTLHSLYEGDDAVSCEA